MRIVRNVVQRVPTRRTPVSRKRVEQERVIKFGPVARRQCPVLLFDIQTNERTRPIEQIRHYDAHAFAGARRRGQDHPLLTTQGQELILVTPKQYTVLGEKARCFDLAALRPPRIAMQTAPTWNQKQQCHSTHHAETGAGCPHNARADRWSIPVVVAVLGYGQWTGRVRL